MAPPCCRPTIEHESVQKSDLNTHFVDEEFDPSALELEDPERDELAALAATLYYRYTQEDEASTITGTADGRDGLSP